MAELQTTERKFRTFTNKYYFLLEDTWRKSKKDPALREQLDERQYSILNRGEVEWNSYIEEIIETAGQHTYLLGLISFHFEEKIYSGLADFNGYNFAFRTYFDNCTFKKKFTMYRGSISQLLSFSNTIFHESVEYGETEILSNLEFINTTFKDDFLIHGCNIEKNIVFTKKCMFYKNTGFISSEFTKSLLLGDSIYKKNLPDLRESSFNKSVDFSSINYNEEKIMEEIEGIDSTTEDGKISIQGDISNFNKLKNLANSNSDYRNANNFFVLSLKSNTLLDPWHLKFITWLYKITSNFGRSLIRPLISLLFILIVMFLINYYSIDIETSKCGETYKNEWILTIQRSLPFGIGFEQSTIECAKETYEANKIAPITTQVFNMFQAILSYILWFLLILAIRNRFRI